MADNSSEQLPPKTRVRLDAFDPAAHFNRGKPLWFEAAWYLCKCAFFLSAIPWPSAWKVRLLRAFGARVGKGVVIKPRVNFHMPWRLQVGDHSWFGEEVFILNLDVVTIGSHCCFSQRAFLCTGNHDFREPAFSFRNAPIVIEDGVWIGAQVFVAPGVKIETDTVVTAGAVVTSNLPAAMICNGNPARPIKQRWTR